MIARMVTLTKLNYREWGREREMVPTVNRRHWWEYSLVLNTREQVQVMEVEMET